MHFYVPNLFELYSSGDRINDLCFFICTKRECENQYPLKKYVTGTEKKYTYEIVNDIKVPEFFELKYRWFYVNKSVVYYRRNVMGIPLKFSYDSNSGKMFVNRFYHHLIKFELGNIWPSGKVLSNFICNDLQKVGYGIFHGVSFKKDGCTFCLFAPGGNYKTSLVKKLLSSGACYIAEDKVVLKDCKSFFVPTVSGSEIKYSNIALSSSIDYVIFANLSDRNELCKDLSVEDIDTYLDIYNVFNFLGKGWALNALQLYEKHAQPKSWYENLKLSHVKGFYRLSFKDIIYMEECINKLIGAKEDE